MPDVIDDLEAEQDQLETVLGELTPAEWLTPSAAAGWTVTDVVLHLAQTEEAVSAPSGAPDWRRFGATVDEAMDAMVRAEGAGPPAVFERWRAARRASVRTLRAADPEKRIPWVAAALKPRTLATTRLAEHWAHALDITDPLAVDYPDTARLRHIAWLGHSTLPYAFRLAGLPAAEVRCALTAPDGATWQFGAPGAASVITGPAAAFCRVGARRLTPSDSGLRTEGPHAGTALRLLRNYADV
ncbi:maleylpyruvate isomerase family mycothiol-dependent enzyme [Paractinoplanes atraurantiacus]|uniref:TIGR03084 family protein n=1 Tax=Paractinoplanes atraurantiacus TaxID=1036182 RepID=A0A285HMW5_9ACTN|nr:maleylpyruvate isomerase family mycothiol-dependent enzyme [Actinoplanes atraurantiacus]SNY37004.1 TIGR03084 family protein [Actinoplanes atraurantiacus]